MSKHLWYPLAHRLSAVSPTSSFIINFTVWQEWEIPKMLPWSHSPLPTLRPPHSWPESIQSTDFSVLGPFPLTLLFEINTMCTRVPGYWSLWFGFGNPPGSCLWTESPQRTVLGPNWHQMLYKAAVAGQAQVAYLESLFLQHLVTSFQPKASEVLPMSA